MDKNFKADYTQILSVLQNKRPKRLPLYEHHIDDGFIKKIDGFNLPENPLTQGDLEEYYRMKIEFWRSMTYDAFDYEAPVCNVYPDHGAILGGRPGPIQTRKDFETYPFDEIPDLFWKAYSPHLEAIRKTMPEGMKAYGGCGYGIFESAQDLVGYEYLCVMQYTDPDLFSDVFRKIGDLYEHLWTQMVRQYSDIFVFFRMGDDLGFKSSTLLEPETIITHILPQYKRIIDLVHRNGKLFLLHSCGNIFSIMDNIIDLGIDAKHSNEDEIAEFEVWIDRYGDKIGLFGGIDVNILTLNKPEEVRKIVKEKGVNYRKAANGFGLGSGNSIPDYVPLDSFLAMIEAAKEIREMD